ncbi:MAG: NAD(P)-dependent dehydrogenase (short-subunit alcohol dehydrogenase family) [Candidatus Azotimanducaceae bacterium]|jgi:NAD(P)-dependent dehydrogenase (short-subunit alcohol dehydrogenase family)
MKIAVVTGTSTGIGFETTLHLARNGYRVFAGMRNTAKAQPLIDAAAAESLPVEIVQMDVTNSASVTAAFALIHQTGDVSLLVNNAGIGGATPLELTPEVEHRQIFETNYFGTIACMQAVLPSMRENGKGDIVNISSIVGVLATPNQIAYSASKYAVEGATEALAHEVYRFGVRVYCVEPGVVATNIFDNSADSTRYDKTSPYQPIMRRNGKLYAAGFKAPAVPQQVADAVLTAITQPTYQFRWPVGVDAAGICAGRAKISAEQWIEMGDDLSDAEYNERFQAYFNVQL